MADCLETNENLIEKGNNQNQIKIKNNINIDVHNQFTDERKILKVSSISYDKINNFG